MTDGSTYDFLIAVDIGGDAHVVEAPEGFGGIPIDRIYRGDAGDFHGLPIFPGVYRVRARHHATLALKFDVERCEPAKELDQDIDHRPIQGHRGRLPR